MGSIRKVIFPAILVCSLALIFLTKLMGNPQMEVQAAAVSDVPAVLQVIAAAALEDAPTPAPAAVDAVGAAAEPQPAPAAEPQPEEQGAGCAVSEAYPQNILQWCDLITGRAAEYGVDANLVAAVMLQESGGDSQAYSGSGAVGLLQVMPRDGLAAGFMCKNGPCFAARPSMQELFDPAFNVDYGTRMLANLISRTGDVREALRAYGPMDMGYRYADLVLAIYERYS